ncbi:MAG: DUF234 domain-containing protein [candidate division KSB1 bacterium]|nr:DUF234 domain-containing protein [candidate division KSB1 bacterium]
MKELFASFCKKNFFALNCQFDRIGRHWDSQTEIDVFAYTQAGDTVIGEIKWTASPVNEEVVHALDKKILHLGSLPKGAIQKLIISKSGFVRGLAKKRADVILIDLGKFKV